MTRRSGAPLPPNGEPPPPWGAHELREGGSLALVLGPLELRFAAEHGEILGAHGPVGREPEPEEWTRWATRDWNGSVSILPIFPDRPLVIYPETAFWLVAGAEARIYVRIPLWVHVEALGTERTSLAKLPTVAQSDTWWGTLEAGELCYWLETSARRAVDPSIFQPHLAVCPIQLVNRSEDPLPVEKIALRPSYLSLFAEEGRLWADETRVSYDGEAEGAELDVGGVPPREAPSAGLVAGPRIRLTRGLRALSVARLRSLQGWI